MNVPVQKPGRSEQVVCTPPEFLAAVKRRLRITTFFRDLAASADNRVAGLYFDEQMDALSQIWYDAPGTHQWCNPPFGKIAPWVAKAHDAAEYGAHISILLPAAVGANWFRDHVDGKALVLFLNGRLTFVGHTSPYPKDLMLCLYGETPGYEVWDWRKS